MSFAMNDLVQEACEDLSLTGIGEAVEGKLAAAAEGCVNRGIAQLNGDGYMSLAYRCHDINAPGKVFFRLLEDGEQKPSTINEAPPDSIENVARKVGIRYMRLRPTSRDQLDSTQTFSYPTAYTYGVEHETAPSGETRQVGIIYTNGTYPTDFRIYVNSQLPKYKLGDTIYLSSLYRNLILYATEMKLVELMKLKSYEAQVLKNLSGAQKMIDTKHANNTPDCPETDFAGSPYDAAANLLGGVGL